MVEKKAQYKNNMLSKSTTANISYITDTVKSIREIKNKELLLLLLINSQLFSLTQNNWKQFLSRFL